MATKGKPAQVVKPKARPQQSGLVSRYLTFYNFASTLLWASVLNAVITHMLTAHAKPLDWDTDYQTFFDGMKDNFSKDMLLRRASTACDSFGFWVKVVQTVALLEPIHIMLGFVRANLNTTIAQVASRLALVWGVLELFPETRNSPFYIPMVLAWSISEIVRYMNYMSILMDSPSETLQSLRYSLFYILYPVGAGSEATFIWNAQHAAEARFGPIGKMACQGLAGVVWPVSLAVLMSHMHAQRRKHLKAVSKEKKQS